jgi:hypothetical protein
MGDQMTQAGSVLSRSLVRFEAWFRSVPNRWQSVLIGQSEAKKRSVKQQSKK